MKRILISLGALLLLSGCGRANVAYRMTFSTNDPMLQKELAQSAARVIQGRLMALGTQVGLTDIVLTNSGTVIEAKNLPKDSAEKLTFQLTQPLNFAIMEQAPIGQAEINVENLGGIKGSGVTEKHVDRVQVTLGATQAENAVTITFTPEGQTLLKQVFARNQGKAIAITVRHHLVSTMTVDKNLLGKSIIQVVGAPKDFAEAFADDVNVGSHITFAPVTDEGK